MADVGLDDFFAKRDKKKKSKKNEEKFVVDDVAKILDAKTKERRNLETNKSTYQVPVSEGQEPGSDYKADGDDEWKEAVDDKPDYTGLKIQELVLEDEEDEETKETGTENETLKEGPWKKAQQLNVKEKGEVEPEVTTALPVPVVPAAAIPALDEEITTPRPSEESKEGDETPAGEVPKKKYIPPHMKGKESAHVSATSVASGTSAAENEVFSPATPAPLTTSTSGAYVPPSKRGLGTTPSSTVSKPRKSAAVPKINDEELFPSLGGKP